MPTYEKTLQTLKQEWQDCTNCQLGVRRQEVGGAFVFGEGRTGGIMFIGEGPGVEEESDGRPFIGQSGEILRKVIGKLGITEFYISNLVACRSCQHAHNSQGDPLFYKDRETRLMMPRMKDEPPFPTHIEACSQRLYEEIYLVDPVLIVSLGAEAAKALTRKALSITSASGTPQMIEIPGAWSVPSITEKKKSWVRKTGGQINLPVVQNKVQYLLLPTLHPNYVLRKWADKSLGNPLEVFMRDLKAAVAIYDRYMLEVHGIDLTEREVSTDDMFDEET